MPDLFDDVNRIIKKDLLPIVIKYLKDPRNKITENLNDFLNDPQIFKKDIFEKFSKNKSNDNSQCDYTEIEKVNDINPAGDNEYDDLFRRLIVIEDNMIQIEKILRDKN